MKGLRIHICNHSKTSLCVGDQKWQLSFCQILESKGLVKITCVLAVIYWYCRVKHGHLQDFRLACYRYKCPGGPFLFDFGWVLPLFFREKGEDCLVCFLEIFWSFGFSLFLNVGSTPEVSVCISLLWPVWIGLLRIEIGELSFFLVRKKSR